MKKGSVEGYTQLLTLGRVVVLSGIKERVEELEEGVGGDDVAVHQV